MDRRLAALEHSVAEIHAQLDDIRTIITSALDVIFSGNEQRRGEIEGLSEHLAERLDPVFHRVFPRHREFLDEVDNIVREARR